MTPEVEKVAKAICAETCAFMGQLTFIAGERGQPMTKESFGNFLAKGEGLKPKPE